MTNQGMEDVEGANNDKGFESETEGAKPAPEATDKPADQKPETATAGLSTKEMELVIKMGKGLEKMDTSEGVKLLTKTAIYLDQNLAFRAARGAWKLLPGISQRLFAGTNMPGKAMEALNPAMAKMTRWFVSIGLLEVKGEDTKEVAEKTTADMKKMAMFAKLLSFAFPEIKPFLPLIDLSGKLAEKGDKGLAQVRANVEKARTEREVPETEEVVHDKTAHADPIAVKPLGVRSDMSEEKKKAVRDAGLIGAANNNERLSA